MQNYSKNLTLKIQILHVKGNIRVSVNGSSDVSLIYQWSRIAHRKFRILYPSLHIQDSTHHTQDSIFKIPHTAFDFSDFDEFKISNTIFRTLSPGFSILDSTMHILDKTLNIPICIRYPVIHIPTRTSQISQSNFDVSDFIPRTWQVRFRISFLGIHYSLLFSLLFNYN